MHKKYTSDQMEINFTNVLNTLVMWSCVWHLSVIFCAYYANPNNGKTLFNSLTLFSHNRDLSFQKYFQNRDSDLESVSSVVTKDIRKISQSVSASLKRKLESKSLDSEDDFFTEVKQFCSKTEIYNEVVFVKTVKRYESFKPYKMN